VLVTGASGFVGSYVMRLVALFDPRMRQLLPLLGDIRHATSAKAERVLGWKPRSREDAIVATAESLVEAKAGAVTPAYTDYR
jgi:dihydroflavonol-4-reductase